jgi:hypothetical protein
VKRQDIPRHFKVEPQYIWNVLQSPAEAVMASWVMATARRVWIATMVGSCFFEFEL